MKRWRLAATAGAVIMAITLVACADDGRERQLEQQRQDIELGKMCFDAGGNWVYNGWDGWKCEFRGSPSEEYSWPNGGRS